MVRLRGLMGLDRRSRGCDRGAYVWIIGAVFAGLVLLLTIHVPLDLGGICFVFAVGLVLLRGPPRWEPALICLPIAGSAAPRLSAKRPLPAAVVLPPQSPLRR